MASDYRWEEIIWVRMLWAGIWQGVRYVTVLVGAGVSLWWLVGAASEYMRHVK